MKRYFVCLLLAVFMSLFVGCSPGVAQGVDTTGWVDIGGLWVRESYISVNLFHHGDRSVFTDNEDLVLTIVRTLTD